MLRLVAATAATTLLLVATLAHNNRVGASGIPFPQSVPHQLTRASLGLPHATKAAAHAFMAETCGKSPQELLKWGAFIKDAFVSLAPQTPIDFAAFAREYGCSADGPDISCVCRSKMQEATLDAVERLAQHVAKPNFDIVLATEAKTANRAYDLLMGLVAGRDLTQVYFYTINHMLSIDEPSLSWRIQVSEPPAEEQEPRGRS